MKIEQILPGIERLWEMTGKGDPEVKVAVLDGPVDFNHKSLKDAKISSLDHMNSGKVNSFHGTFICSLIFSNHRQLVKGVAPNCEGVVKRIFHEGENGELMSSSQADIADGIHAALEAGADIINISGGERMHDDGGLIHPLKIALEKCEEAGVLVVAATGNDGADSIDIPASFPTVLAVGSITDDGNPSVFSNWSWEENDKGIVAPGENIIGAAAGKSGSEVIASGTSFSNALVSGVAALLLSLQKSSGGCKKPLTIRKILLNSVTPCKAEEGINCDPIMHGRLNIDQAISQLAVTPASTCSCQKENEKIRDADKDPLQTTKDQNSITINQLNMNEEKEVMPSATADVVEAVTQEQSSPESHAGAEAGDSQVQTYGVDASAVEESVSEQSQVEPSNAAPISFNPMINSGGLPTFQNSQLVNAIGQPSYNFGTQNNLDTFTAMMRSWYDHLPAGRLKDELTNSPHDHKSMAAFLLYKSTDGYTNAYMGSQLIWLLNMNSTPIYAISPKLSDFRGAIYLILEQFLADNVGINAEAYSKYTEELSRGTSISPEDPIPAEVFIDDKDEDDVMRMVLPGYVSGTSRLMNGNHVESVTPVAYGLKDWTVNALVESIDVDDEETKKQLISVLNRLYISTTNKGQTPNDRALNYSLYNILELSNIVTEITKEKLQLSNCDVRPSKISRQNSISREVRLTFFDPANTNKASITYSMQVDVSGVTPIIIGETQKWYAPVSMVSA